MRRVWPWFLGAGALMFLFGGRRKGGGTVNQDSGLGGLGDLDISGGSKGEGGQGSKHDSPVGLPHSWMEPYYQGGVLDPRIHALPPEQDWQWSIQPWDYGEVWYPDEEKEFLDKVLAFTAQHEGDFVRMYSLANDEEKMDVFSSGTLAEPEVTLRAYSKLVPDATPIEEKFSLRLGNGVTSYRHLDALISEHFKKLAEG